MDMNWIDEIRDPEPRKRYIYNADDYDPQYGDPYYREHSTRADSLWRLYEESGTSITFDAFADNRLDFIRALTKARGMDPISSDREIGAFLNTFDKLAAMPEPTPAKQEKDELSAGACDPADPLNLEQSSSYGMTR